MARRGEEHWAAYNDDQMSRRTRPLCEELIALAGDTPRDFTQVWTLVCESLRPGAWLAVNLLGERDSWAGAPDETFFGEAAARTLFDGLQLLRFTEEDGPGDSYSGQKHGHVFDVISRSRS